MKKPTRSSAVGLRLCLPPPPSTAGPVRQSQRKARRRSLAVAEIQYIDTSGEVIDQSADHFRRLREFEASLRTDLAASGKVRNVTLDCPAKRLFGRRTSMPDQLLDKAQAAGAAYLLISSFHKVSTLVQWAKFDIVEVKTRNVVFNRLVTFRGDNDTGLAPRGNLHRPGNPGS